MTEDFNYDDIFAQVDRENEQESGLRGECDDNGCTPLFNKQGKYVGYEDSAGKVHYDSLHKQRGRRNVAYDYGARKRLEERARRQKIRASLKPVIKKVKLADRDTIEAETIHLSAKNSNSVIVNDAETLAKLEEEFEGVYAGFNGFGVFDISDGRLDEFEEFAKEHKLKVYPFPLATYYLTESNFRSKLAAPAGNHKYCIIEELDLEDMIFFDKVVNRELIETNLKGGIDLLISTCKYIGFDDSTVADLINQFNPEIDNTLLNYILEEEIGEFLENRLDLRAKLETARRKCSNRDVAKLITITNDSDLIQVKEEIIAGLHTNEEIVNHYIKLQTKGDKRKINYQKSVDFWDNLDHRIRSMCKTGIVRGKIKELDLISSSNKYQLDNFLSNNPEIKQLFEDKAMDYYDYKAQILLNLDKVDLDITKSYQKVQNAQKRLKTARTTFETKLKHSNENYVPLKRRLNSLKYYSKDENASEIKEIEQQIKKIQLTEPALFKKHEDAKFKIHQLKRSYENLLADSNQLHAARWGENENTYLITALFENRILLTEELDQSFFSELESKHSASELIRILPELIRDYKPLTLEDLATDSVDSAKKQISQISNKVKELYDRKELIFNNMQWKRVKPMVSAGLRTLQGRLDRLISFEDRNKDRFSEAENLKGYYYSGESNDNLIEHHDEISFRIKQIVAEIKQPTPTKKDDEDKKISIDSRVRLGVLSKLSYLDKLIQDQSKLFHQGSNLVRNISKSLHNRDYLELHWAQGNNTFYVSKGNKYAELEERGDACPMGLSKNWYTPKIRFLSSGIEFSQHYFNNLENKIITGEEKPAKIEFKDYDNSFILHLKDNRSVSLSLKHADELLTHIETYAIDALQISSANKQSTGATPTIEYDSEFIKLSGESDVEYNLFHTYSRLKEAVANC